MNPHGICFICGASEDESPYNFLTHYKINQITHYHYGSCPFEEAKEIAKYCDTCLQFARFLGFVVY